MSRTFPTPRLPARSDALDSELRTARRVVAARRGFTDRILASSAGDRQGFGARGGSGGTGGGCVCSHFFLHARASGGRQRPARLDRNRSGGGRKRRSVWFVPHRLDRSFRHFPLQSDG